MDWRCVANDSNLVLPTTLASTERNVDRDNRMSIFSPEKSEFSVSSDLFLTSRVDFSWLRASGRAFHFVAGPMYVAHSGFACDTAAGFVTYRELTNQVVLPIRQDPAIDASTWCKSFWNNKLWNQRIESDRHCWALSVVNNTMAFFFAGIFLVLIRELLLTTCQVHLYYPSTRWGILPTPRIKLRNHVRPNRDFCFLYHPAGRVVNARQLRQGDGRLFAAHPR